MAKVRQFNINPSKEPERHCAAGLSNFLKALTKSFNDWTLSDPNSFGKHMGQGLRGTGRSDQHDSRVPKASGHALLRSETRGRYSEVADLLDKAVAINDEDPASTYETGHLTWGGRGSNPRPMDYESTALTD